MNIRIVEGPQAGQNVALDGDAVTIGRGRDNDVVLTGEGISRHHFRVTKSGDDWLVEDLGSVNGVTLNGNRIEGAEAIRPGDEITVCAHRFSVVEDAEQAATVPPLPVTEVEDETPAGTDDEDSVPLWDDDAERPKRVFPWGRAALLVILVGLIAFLASMLWPPSGSSARNEDESDSAMVAEEPVDDSDTTEPREITDDELAALIAREEEQAPEPDAEGDLPGEPSDRPEPPDGDVARNPRPMPPVEDREPEARVTEEGRAVVTDVVYVASDPTGATVFVDGDPRGTTPLLIQNLPKGRHRILLKKEGYEESERHIHVPDLLPTQPYPLRQKPGTLRVNSTQAGTAVWRGPQLLGVAPTLIPNLDPGEHDLVFVTPGCETVRKAVTISQLRGEQVDVSPVRMLGALEIITLPAGCEVTVEGGLAGVTPPGEKGVPMSSVLRFDHLRPGAYGVRVSHPAGVESSGKLPVKPGETVRKTVKLWVPDTRLTMIDGTTKTGMLVDKNEQGDVVLAETPRTLERYLKPQIKRLVRLQIDDIRAYLDKRAGGDRQRSPATGRDRNDRNAPPDETPDTWGDNPADQPQQGDADGADARPPVDEAAGREPPVILASDLNQMFEDMQKLDVERRLQGRSITIRGVPSSSGRDGSAGYIAFGRRIRCSLGRDYFDKQKERLQNAENSDAEMTVTGSVAGMRGGALVLNNCTFERAEDNPR